MLNFASIRSAIRSSFAPAPRAESDRQRAFRLLELETLEDRMMLSSVTLQAGNVIEVIGSETADHIVVKDFGPYVDATVVTGSERLTERFRIANPAKVVVHGLNGNDKIVNKTAAPLEAFGGRGNDTILGGINDDILNGGIGKDQIYGFGGDDTINGDASADILVGGKGNDTISGGDHNDRLFGLSGEDRLFGGNGADLIRGGDGNDFVNGNLGQDRIYGENGHDELHGDNGCVKCNQFPETPFAGNPDRVYGGEGNDIILGNGGNDLLFGQGGEDEIHGWFGNDTIYGNRDHDLLYGGGGNNLIYAGAGDDYAYGGPGNDLILGEQGKDTLEGGAGNDKVRGGIDNDKLIGNEGDDRLYGDEGSDMLEGSNGNDLLYGGLPRDKKDGNDTINGGPGNDWLFGYYGNDSLHGDGGIDRLYGSFGADYLDGGDDRDLLYGEAGADKLFGRSGNDHLDGGSHNDRLMGGTGDDRLQGKEGSDNIEGEEGNDTLIGDRSSNRRGGRDTIRGGAGNDLLIGSYGNDRLYGGAGGDIIRGDHGNDYLTDHIGPENILAGGPGNDEIAYLFNPGDLHGTIKNGGRYLELAGYDEDYPDSGFTLMTTGSSLWTVRKVGSKYVYKATGTILLDLDDNNRPSISRDMILSSSGFTFDTFAAETVEESIIDPASLDVDLLGNGVRDFLQSIRKTTGLGIKLPSLRFGIASGQELMDDDASLPLRASQPYLYFTVNRGFGLSFGSASLAVPSGAGVKSFAIVVDPTDLFFLAKGEFSYKKGDLGVAIGYSEKGRIPFRPNAELEDWKGELFGNLFIELNGVPLPNGFSVDGNLTIDLDANDDGNMLIDPKRELGQLAPGGAFYSRIVEASKDLKVGVNGTLKFGADFKKKVKSDFLKKLFDELKVSGEVELAEGAIVYDGLLQGIHLKGQSVNPFKNTPLEKLEFLVGRKELSGSVTSFGSNPQFKLDYYGIQGGSLASRTDEFHLNNSGASFRGASRVLGQSVELSGGIRFDGTIYLRGTARAGTPNIFSEETGGASAGVYFDIRGEASLSDLQFTVSARLDAWANAITYGLLNVKSGFAADLTLTGRVELGLKSNSVSFQAKADVSLYVVGVRFGVSPSFGVSVSPNRFSFNAGPHEVVVSW